MSVILDAITNWLYRRPLKAMIANLPRRDWGPVIKQDVEEGHIGWYLMMVLDLEPAVIQVQDHPRARPKRYSTITIWETQKAYKEGKK